MKKKIFSAIILLGLLIPSFGKIYGEEITPPTPPEPINIHLSISTPSSSLYNQDITVNACDSDNPNSGNLKITAYCAVLQSGLSTDWNFTWAPGIFLNSINNIAGFTSKDNDGNDVYHYWSWSLNGTEAQVGLNQYDLQSNDLITLTFIDPVVPPPPIPVVEEKHHSSGSKIIIPQKKVFDLKKAYEFLISQQKENGSWGSDLYTDWTAIALGTTSEYKEQKEKLVNYYKNLKTENYTLTDYERHSMALMALGIDPQNVNGENYIEKIVKEFDSTQFGDKEKINDDIFAVIVLENINSTKNEEMIKKAIDFVISKQKENGSWDDSVDITGATIQSIINTAEKNCFIWGSLSGLTSPALTLDSSVCESPQNKEFYSAVYKAKEFLKQNQKDDGSFGNVSSTAWAMGGIISLNKKPTNSVENETPETFDIQKVFRDDWIKNNNTPLDYLAINQDNDGGIKETNLENRIWQTAYVLSALSEKTWTEIMQKFNAQPLASDETKTIITDTTAKPTVQKTINKTKKIQNLSKEITASPIQAIPENPKTETPKKQSWFKRLLNIFGF